MNFINNYIQEHNLKLNTDGIKDKYICKICKSVLCEPQISNCGCSYCTHCITQLCKSDTYKCPNCYSVNITKKDLHFDIRIKNRITELILECPHEACKTKTSVKDMVSHITNCDNKSYECLLRLYGCHNVLMNKHDLRQHLNNDNGFHFNLLIEYLEEKSNLVDSANKETLENSRKLIDLENKLDETNRDLQIKKVQLENTKTEVINWSEYGNIYDEDTEDNSLHDELTVYLKKLEEMEKVNQELKKHVEELEIMVNTRFVNKMDNLPESLKQQVNIKLDCGVSSDWSHKKLKFTDLYGKLRCVNYFTEIFKLKRYSFQMCLYIYFNGRVSFCLHSILNEHSNQLKWPLPLKIKISLMDRNGIELDYKLIDHEASQNKLDYHKPPRDQYLYIVDARINRYLLYLGDRCSVLLKVL